MLGLSFEHESERQKNAVEKSSDKENGKKKKKSSKRREFFYSLISEGRYTRSEVIEKMRDEYPSCSLSYIRMLISHAKNPKYNPFKELIVEEGNILFFKR